MKTLTKGQRKLDKSKKRGYLSAGFNLSPADESVPHGGRNMCPKAGACKALCLRYAGMNQMTTHEKARVQRTLMWLDHPDAFTSMATSEIDALLRKAERDALTPTLRPNLLSDDPKLARRFARLYPDVQVYDYTKIHLTFSLDVSAENERDALDALDHGINVAVPMDVAADAPMPESWTLNGRTLPMIDGDADDLRFLDPVGIFVGLRGKKITGGRQKGVDAGFYRSPDA